MINADITPPDMHSRMRLPVKLIVPLPNVVSIVDSSVNIDTHAEARLIVFEAEYTGLLYLRYFTVLIIASVSEVNVYVAKAMVVIS
jgi:hypothetical protein